ncbi:MAG: hypothetical protein U1E42_13735 [Rhodospirillales bacterium]
MLGSRTAACAALAFLTWASTADAQSSGQASAPILRDTAFQTCAEAQAMAPDQRKALALNIAHAAAAYYQTQIGDSEEIGQQIGWLIRSGCTIAPETYFSTTIARAIRVMGGGIEPPLQQPLDMKQAVFASCAGANSLPPDQLKQLGTYIGTEAAAHYGLTPGADWTPDYIAALVHNGCQMYPDAYYLGIIGRAIRAVSPRPEAAAAPAPHASKK